MITILIADGDQILRDLYLRFFSRQGWKVRTCGGGMQCLTELRRESPHVLILDMQLLWGGVDGLLAIMNSDSVLAHIPVIVTSTSEAAAEARSSSFASPVRRVMGKPFSLAELRDVVLGELRNELQPADGRKGSLVRSQCIREEKVRPGSRVDGSRLRGVEKPLPVDLRQLRSRDRDQIFLDARVIVDRMSEIAKQLRAASPDDLEGRSKGYQALDKEWRGLIANLQRAQNEQEQEAPVRNSYRGRGACTTLRISEEQDHAGSR